MSETEFRDPSAVKSPAVPRFHTKAIKMEFSSTQAGRPIFEDREFVDIIIPGDRRALAHEPVNDEHKARWPREYEAFKANRELPLEGTPLSEWPTSHMTPSRVEELAYFNIRTVEQLAAVTDAHLQNLGMGSRELREKAKLFLDVAKNGTGPLERLVARMDGLEADRTADKARIAELMAENAALKQENAHARASA